MIRVLPWPKRLKDVPKGALARTVREWRGYRLIIPAGTTGTVRPGSMWDRFDFIARECECCGVQPRATMGRGSLELIEEVAERPVVPMPIEDHNSLCSYRSSGGTRSCDYDCGRGPVL